MQYSSALPTQGLLLPPRSLLLERPSVLQESGRSKASDQQTRLGGAEAPGRGEQYNSLERPQHPSRFLLASFRFRRSCCKPSQRPLRLHTRRGGGDRDQGAGRGEAVSAEAMMTTEVAGQKRTGDGFLIGCIAGGAAASGKRLKAAGCGGGVAAATRDSIPAVKEKKDKIGERVTALQQLVSPYGKTDTASVLQEATGYIKFLHEQLQVLSAPYLGGNTPTGKLQEADKYSLRSRGLCLMPVASTLAFARSNGADIWAPINTHRA